MKRFALFLLVMGFSAGAYAETLFTPEAFHAAQVNGDKILLHFHADWCPTCRAQISALSHLEKEGALNDIVFLTVDYDKEKEFEKTMHVTEQATFIAFYGTVETGRVTGITGEADIKEFIDKSLATVNLNEQLRRMRDSAQRMPPEKKKILDEAIENLRQSGLMEKALKVGQTMPAFSLPNAHGQIIRLQDLLKNGPLIVTFYRGSWCPYCNVQLNSYQRHLADFRRLGANLVAITPEKPDLTLLTEEKKELKFEILTDKDNELARKLGLVYGVTGELKALYKQLGVDLEKSQGNSDWQLPVPATYIVSKTGKVVYAFVNVDYTRRADPQDLLRALEQLGEHP